MASEISSRVIPDKGVIYLSPLNSTYLKIVVTPANGDQNFPAEAATFCNCDGTFVAKRESYVPICGTPPFNVRSQSPAVIGNWVLAKLDFFGRRIALLKNTPSVFGVATTYDRFLNVLRIIDQKSSEWAAEVEANGKTFHKKKRDLTLSVAYSPGKSIYMSLSQNLARSQKKVGLVLDVAENVVYIAHKPYNKSRAGTTPKDYQEIFAAEVARYRLLLGKSHEKDPSKKVALEGVLLPREILEYLEDGQLRLEMIFPRIKQNLHKRIKERPFTENEIPKVIYGVVRSVLNLQRALELNHGDIKGKNFLIDEQNNIYVIDFGIMRHRGIGVLQHLSGTRGFIPPEYLGDRTLPRFDFDKLSSWCLGMVVLWIIKGKPLLYRLNKDMLENKKAFLVELELLQKANIHPKYNDMVKGLLKENPNQRMKIEDSFKIAAQYYSP